MPDLNVKDLLLFLFSGYTLVSLYYMTSSKKVDNPFPVQGVQCDLRLDSICKQRNTVSGMLNRLSQKMGKMQCERSKGTAEGGGYCKRGVHLGADKTLLPALSDFLQGKTVASFGDGTGQYKNELLKLGKIKSYDSYDGGPFSEEESKGNVKYMDLTIPQYGLHVYDWVMSIEVAEHIPKQYERIFLDNIFRHAKDGIILSWAVPGQGGFMHVNNKSVQYVMQVMNKNGFQLDENSSKLLQQSCTFPHLKRKDVHDSSNMMNNNANNILLLLLSVNIILGLYYTTLGNRDDIEQNDSNMVNVRNQRNTVSEMLNKLSKKMGKLQCERRKPTVEGGGYCKRGNHNGADTSLIPALSDFLQGKTVASFGDGTGQYKNELLKLKKIKSYDSYDGGPFSEEESKGNVKYMDLTIPQYGLPVWDWVMSIEVAEHIPKQYESIFLDNIFRHAKEGVILSWAVPGQGGLNHVNNRPISYVIKVMNSSGFQLDKSSSQLLQNSCSFKHLKRNLYVYKRTLLMGYQDLYA
ncbi:unnamed protein product [Mytilus edulis]|uniref:Uncharacterized protein n=2 Tax=Mytilus edulis TaxID=6550 RepID=A0A8S3U8W0_MYTED|nr:unnamed protein product [Mytilus edulis]